MNKKSIVLLAFTNFTMVNEISAVNYRFDQKQITMLEKDVAMFHELYTRINELLMQQVIQHRALLQKELPISFDNNLTVGESKLMLEKIDCIYGLKKEADDTFAVANSLDAVPIEVVALLQKLQKDEHEIVQKVSISDNQIDIIKKWDSCLSSSIKPDSYYIEQFKVKIAQYYQHITERHRIAENKLMTISPYEVMQEYNELLNENQRSFIGYISDYVFFLIYHNNYHQAFNVADMIINHNKGSDGSDAQSIHVQAEQMHKHQTVRGAQQYDNFSKSHPVWANTI